MNSHSIIKTAHEPPRAGEGVFELGDLALQSGTVFRNAKLAYKIHGQLNTDRSNAILYPTPIAAQHGDIEWLIGPGKALDPDRYSPLFWISLVTACPHHQVTLRHLTTARAFQPSRSRTTWRRSTGW
jgi:homoserine acetyltransferase